MNVREKFQAARNFASGEVKQWLQGGEIIGDESAREVLLWWMLDMCHNDDANGKPYVDAPLWAIDFLFTRAIHDEAARRLMTKLVASKLLSSLLLSKDEAVFAALALEGILPAIKAKPGRKREANFNRNMFLVSLVDDLINRFGLPLSRNDATKQAQSACDAVAEAFAECGRHEITFKTVKDVCNDRRLRGVLMVINREIEASISRGSETPRNALAGCG